MNEVRKAAAQLPGGPASGTGKGLTEGYMEKQPEMFPKSVSSQISETQILNSKSQTLTMTLGLAERAPRSRESCTGMSCYFHSLDFLCGQRYQNLEKITTSSEL